VRIQVSDTGMGMAPDVLAKAFEPFFTTKEPGKGTGLGLSTAYGIIRRASGLIEIDSRPGEGTTVRVLLPRASDANVAVRSSAPPSGEVAVQRDGGTILVVEDQRVIRELVEQTLSEAGYRVFSAAGPREAMAIAEQQSTAIDLLLTDVVMPQMRGPELAARLRVQRPDLPVVFMSGYTGESLENAGVDAGELLEKPFGTDALLARVDGAMKRRKRAPRAS
jgi:CheY-like chemotaxis protein